MKRTSANLKLKQRLELVRATVRELTPRQLAGVNGGGGNEADGLISTNCPTKCCDGYTYAAPPAG